MKTLVFAVIAGVLLFATPAFALQCDVDLASIDGVMTSVDSNLSAVEFEQAMALRNSAKALCANGDEAGAADVIAQLQGMLGM